jgi:hypothetical protein
VRRRGQVELRRAVAGPRKLFAKGPGRTPTFIVTGCGGSVGEACRKCGRHARVPTAHDVVDVAHTNALQNALESVGVAVAFAHAFTLGLAIEVEVGIASAFVPFICVRF